MEKNKKIDTVFGLVVIAFLAVVVFVIGNINAGMVSEQKDYEVAMSHLLYQRNNKIRMLSVQLAAKQKESENLQKALTSAKNDLEVISKKLAEASSVPAPSPAPAPAAAAK